MCSWSWVAACCSKQLSPERLSLRYASKMKDDRIWEITAAFCCGPVEFSCRAILYNQLLQCHMHYLFCTEEWCQTSMRRSGQDAAGDKLQRSWAEIKLKCRFPRTSKTIKVFCGYTIHGYQEADGIVEAKSQDNLLLCKISGWESMWSRHRAVFDLPLESLNLAKIGPSKWTQAVEPCTLRGKI